jgi:hypothetical protein
MRAAIVVTVALGLAMGSTLAFAQGNNPSSSTATLTPGQPAGLKQAQMGSSTLPIILGVGLVAGGIALAAGSGGDDNRQPIAATTTTFSTP